MSIAKIGVINNQMTRWAVLGFNPMLPVRKKPDHSPFAIVLVGMEMCDQIKKYFDCLKLLHS